jgi:hypothetical protein
MRRRTGRGLVARYGLVLMTAVTLTACGSKEPSTDADRLARGRELVQQMSARLAAVQSLSVTTTETRDRVRSSGRREAISVAGTYTMRRPDRFYTQMTGGPGLESWYNGKTVTIASHPEKVFAQAPMPDTIDRTLDALAERYDMALPLSDLFYSSPAKALLSDTTTGGYAGREQVGGTSCVHLSFKDVGVDWELWLTGRASPEALQGNTESPDRRARNRCDFRRVEAGTADHRRELRSQGTGRVRGYRDPAAGRRP